MPPLLPVVFETTMTETVAVHRLSHRDGLELFHFSEWENYDRAMAEPAST